MSEPESPSGQAENPKLAESSAERFLQNSSTSWWRFAAHLAALLSAMAAAIWIALLPGKFSLSYDEEWLLKLAEIGRAGAAVLCDPLALQKRLELQVVDGVNLVAGSTEAALELRSAGAVAGNYSKLHLANAVVCRLQLRFARGIFCDTQSARIQRLLGSRLQVGLPMPGESGNYDHGYLFLRPGSEQALIGWRTPTKGCSPNVEIVAVSS